MHQRCKKLFICLQMPATLTLLLTMNCGVRNLLILFTTFSLYLPLWSCPQTRRPICAAEFFPNRSSFKLKEGTAFSQISKCKAEKERKKLHHRFYSLTGTYIGILETSFLSGNTLLRMTKRGLPGVATSGFLALGPQWLLLCRPE